MKNPFQKYPRESAGRLMTSQAPLIFRDQTLSQVQAMLFKKMRELEVIDYLYVITEDKKLIGVISLKEIFRQSGETKVNDIMEEDLVKILPSIDQEKVAILALKNNLKAIPIVDKENRFLGVVNPHTILGILHKEHVEDILLFSGIPKVDKNSITLMKASALVLAKVRIPWLLLGLLGGVIAAQIIGFFENALRSEILLALFTPVIVYMTDAVATQTETIFIRGLAVDPKLALKKYFLREIKTGAFLGFILGGLLAIVTILWWKSARMGAILFLALFFGTFISVIIAMLIPLVLRKFRKDPALGSGPFATIVTDLLSIVMYFLIANFLLGIL